ncbi:hypothetical protein Lal_00019728, partial [Lupinus albus]
TGGLALDPPCLQKLMDQKGGLASISVPRGKGHKIRLPSRHGKGREEKGAVIYLDQFPEAGVYSTHSLVFRTAQVSVRLRMRTSFPSAHSPFTRFSKQRRKGGQQVPRALCPTHLSRSKCSSPVPPNAPISRQRSYECAVMLRMLRHRIDRPSSRSFLVHSLYISDTQGRTRWEGSSPSLCPADHSAGILHSRLLLTAAQGWSCRYVSLSRSLAPPVISFYDMLLSSPSSICNLVISASLRVSTSERNGGLHSVTPRSPSKRSE